MQISSINLCFSPGIQSYGGLRGAVAFCLAILIKADDGNAESDEFKRTIVTTTISVVIFTCFIQVIINFIFLLFCFVLIKNPMMYITVLNFLN